MEPTLKSEILEFPPNIVYIIRKNHNLEKPGRIEESIDVLDSWIKKQSHFKKKEFDRFYLETCLITCKGSIERTKERIDRLCTLRTLLPEYFKNCNPKVDLNGMEKLAGGILPKLDENNYRVYIFKNLGSSFGADIFTNYFKQQIILAEYLRMHDYTEGFILIFDYTLINVMDMLVAVNLIEVRNILTLLMQGYGMRMKGLHIIVEPSTSTTLMELIFSVMKSLLSDKLKKRFYLHTNLESLYKHVPKKILPLEFGGDEMSIEELSEKWVDVLSSKEHMDFMRDINTAKVDESSRLSDKFKSEYLGLPGSFRSLSFD